MQLDTRNLEHMTILQKIVTKNHTVSVVTDQDFTVRISLRKDAPDEIDSWLAIDDVFDVRGQKEQVMLSEFDFITISDKLIS